MNQNIGLIAKKVGMTHVYAEGGVRRPATVLYTPKCVVTAIRTTDKHGYSALQVGVLSDDPKEQRREKNFSKPLKGQFKGAPVPTPLKEFRVSAEVAAKYKVGDVVGPNIFAKGQRVDVQGRTMGKGYQGVVRKYGFRGFGDTHGTHEAFRGGGSIGQRTWPGRVMRGRKMAGHMGDQVRSVLNLEVLDIIPQENTLVVSGAIPGSSNSWVQVRQAVKN